MTSALFFGCVARSRHTGSFGVVSSALVPFAYDFLFTPYRGLPMSNRIG